MVFSMPSYGRLGVLPGRIIVSFSVAENSFQPLHSIPLPGFKHLVLYIRNPCSYTLQHHVSTLASTKKRIQVSYVLFNVPHSTTSVATMLALFLILI